MKISTGARLAVLGDLKDVFANAVAYGYGSSVDFPSTAVPSTADAAETGELLVIFTKDGGAFTSGSATNGLNFGTPYLHADGLRAILPKNADVWKGVGLVAGTLRYIRIHENTVATGVSAVANRMDGVVLSVSGADFLATSVNIKVGVDVTITQCDVVLRGQK